MIPIGVTNVTSVPCPCSVQRYDEPEGSCVLNCICSFSAPRWMIRWSYCTAAGVNCWSWTSFPDRSCTAKRAVCSWSLGRRWDLPFFLSHLICIFIKKKRGGGVEQQRMGAKSSFQGHHLHPTNSTTAMFSPTSSLLVFLYQCFHPAHHRLEMLLKTSSYTYVLVLLYLDTHCLSFKWYFELSACNVSTESMNFRFYPMCCHKKKQLVMSGNQ